LSDACIINKREGERKARIDIPLKGHGGRPCIVFRKPLTAGALDARGVPTNHPAEETSRDETLNRQLILTKTHECEVITRNIQSGFRGDATSLVVLDHQGINQRQRTNGERRTPVSALRRSGRQTNGLGQRIVIAGLNVQFPRKFTWLARQS